MSRLSGERGSAMVAGLVLMFSFTAGAIVWLARDVDRMVATRASTQSIAFQAARSGAQQLDVGRLRAATGPGVTVDERTAVQAVSRTADRLLEAYGLEGSVATVSVTDDQVTVTVTVGEDGRSVTGTGSARAKDGP
jgi:cytosine/adenosine deaminase-related metal-dependent hydrolase